MRLLHQYNAMHTPVTTYKMVFSCGYQKLSSNGNLYTSILSSMQSLCILVIHQRWRQSPTERNKLTEARLKHIITTLHSISGSVATLAGPVLVR